MYFLFYLFIYLFIIIIIIIIIFAECRCDSNRFSIGYKANISNSSFKVYYKEGEFYTFRVYNFFLVLNTNIALCIQ